MIVAAADGSALSNPGPAGWAWYIDEECWQAGGWPLGTNNMGELQAVLALLQATESVAAEPLKVLCDSQYVINSVTKWLPGWKRKGWRKADGKPVLNQDLLKALDTALAGRDVSFEWVRGHTGHLMNEAADAKARAVATAYKDGTTINRGPGFRGASKKSPEPEPAPPVRLVAPPEPEPDLFSQDPDLGEPAQVDEDLRLVVRLEKELLSDGVRSAPARVRELLHPQYTEFGSSGRIWTRNRLLAEIGPRPARMRYEPIGSDRLADDVILLRWRALSPSGEQLRSSIWQRDNTHWRLRFAQGTQVPPER